jgi:hypothetical protein
MSEKKKVEVFCVNCSNKKEPAKVYCVDCKKPLCKFCVALLHHPTTKAEKHSIEELDADQSLEILTPILLDLLVLGGVVFLMSGSSITPEYFQGTSYCPGVTRARSAFVKYDPNLFFYFKADIAKYCDLEDSYWRFFMDTWIRGVLTETDTWLLICSELVKALAFEELVRIVISHVIPWFFAPVATLVRFVEVQIQRFTYDHEGRKHTLTHFLEKTAKVVEKISLAPKLQLDSGVTVVPRTLRRRRPSEDWLEDLSYQWSRLTRRQHLYSVEAHRACTFVLRGTLVFAVVVRVACMFMGGELFKSLAQLLGSDSVIATHLRWFEENTGMAPKSKGGHISDWAAAILIEQALGGIAPRLFGSAKGLGKGVVGGGGVVLLRFAVVFGLVAGIFAAGPMLLYWKIGCQKEDFKKQWGKPTKAGGYDGGYGKMLWGDMSKTHPCCNWEGNKYKPE